MSNSPPVKILYGEADAEVATAQAPTFAGPDHRVEQAIGRQAIAAALDRERFDLLVLGHTLSKDDRHHLPYLGKRTNPEIRVLVLHASGKHPKVDIAVDSRLGAAVIRQAVADLLLQPAAVA